MKLRPVPDDEWSGREGPVRTTIGSFIFISLLGFSQAFALTKQEAAERMKKNGFKWNLTEALVAESESKLEQANADFRPKVAAAFRQSAARINPVQYGIPAIDNIETVGLGSSMLEFSWLLFDPIAKIEVLSARAHEKMSHSQTLHYQNELTALMLVQYLQVQRLRKQLDALDANLKRSNLILKLAQTRKNLGAGIPLDVARAQTLVQVDNIKKIGIYTKYLKARRDLGILLGVDKLEDDLGPISAKVLPPGKLKTSLLGTLEERHDLKALRYGYEAAAEVARESQQLIFPHLALFGEFGSTSYTALGLPGKSINGAVGVSLTIPLETGGLITGKRHEAAAQLKKAELQMQQVRAEAVSGLKDAMEQLLAAEEALKSSEEYLKMAQMESEIVNKKFKSGSANSLELSSSHTSLASAIDTNVESIFNYEASKVNYYRLLGDFSEYFEDEKRGP